MENRWRSNESLIEQNLDKNKEKFRQQIKLAFKTGDKNENRHNWVLETSREATDILIKKERFYIGCNCCRIQDYIVATRLTSVINVTTPPNIAGMRKKSAVIEQRKGMPSRINALINQRIPYCHKCKRRETVLVRRNGQNLPFICGRAESGVVKDVLRPVKNPETDFD